MWYWRRAEQREVKEEDIIRWQSKAHLYTLQESPSSFLQSTHTHIHTHKGQPHCPLRFPYVFIWEETIHQTKVSVHLHHTRYIHMYTQAYTHFSSKIQKNSELQKRKEKSDFDLMYKQYFSVTIWNNKLKCKSNPSQF